MRILDWTSTKTRSPLPLQTLAVELPLKNQAFSGLSISVQIVTDGLDVPPTGIAVCHDGGALHHQ